MYLRHAFAPGILLCKLYCVALEQVGVFLSGW